MTVGGDKGAWRERALELRRERLVRAMVQVVCERHGFAGASLTAVCARAKVSGAAFYELFDSRESCFLAALDQGHRRCTELVEGAFERTGSWLEGVRLAQTELLLFFDSDPELARVCIVESLAAGPWALERREQHVKALTRVMTGYWGPLAPQEPFPFASEGVVASTLGIIQSHLQAGHSEPLSALLGPLMGLITAPYLDARSVAKEVERSGTLARRLLTQHDDMSEPRSGGRPTDIPDLLLDPRAHRARRCVLYLSEHPQASNREIAKAAGIARDTQISTTLARLASLGLIVKAQSKRGGPNAWGLTPRGLSVAAALNDRGEGDGISSSSQARLDLCGGSSTDIRFKQRECAQDTV